MLVFDIAKGVWKITVNGVKFVYERVSPGNYQASKVFVDGQQSTSKQGIQALNDRKSMPDYIAAVDEMYNQGEGGQSRLPSGKNYLSEILSEKYTSRLPAEILGDAQQIGSLAHRVQQISDNYASARTLEPDYHHLLGFGLQCIVSASAYLLDETAENLEEIALPGSDFFSWYDDAGIEEYVTGMFSRATDQVIDLALQADMPQMLYLWADQMVYFSGLLKVSGEKKELKQLLDSS